MRYAIREAQRGRYWAGGHVWTRDRRLAKTYPNLARALMSRGWFFGLAYWVAIAELRPPCPPRSRPFEGKIG